MYAFQILDNLNHLTWEPSLLVEKEPSFVYIKTHHPILLRFHTM